MARFVLLASIPRMRSESRTEDTSGLVTTSASSAKCIAIRAPVSMPAGESQTMYSKPITLSPPSTFSMPSFVSASLSRVCEAASTERLSHCLSLMSAWWRFASPLMTLIRSYTTRRSHPMMRSRLRRPTSKSITAVLWPRRASPLAKLALVVVLPTPPLPEVTTIIFAISSPFRRRSLEGIEHQPVALGTCYQPQLRGLPPYGRGKRRFTGPVKAGDGNQLRLHAEREDPGIGIAACARHGAAAQGRIHVDVPVRDHFCARVHHGEHHQVAATRVHLLARAQRLVDHQSPGRCRGLRSG